MPRPSSRWGGASTRPRAAACHSSIPKGRRRAGDHRWSLSLHVELGSESKAFRGGERRTLVSHPCVARGALCDRRPLCRAPSLVGALSGGLCGPGCVVPPLVSAGARSLSHRERTPSVLMGKEPYDAAMRSTIPPLLPFPFFVSLLLHAVLGLHRLPALSTHLCLPFVVLCFSVFPGADQADRASA